MRNAYSQYLLAGLMSAIVLVGCGEDGSTGPAGEPGEPGENIPIPVTAGPQDVLNLEITDVNIGANGRPVVEFTVTNGDGIRFIGLTAGQPSFTIAKLVPGTDGDSDHWQNYLNRLEQPDVGPGTEDKIQATTENNGTLQDHEDGTYTYTFATDITEVTSPLAVTYDSSLTHRLGIELRGGAPATNATYTFRPSTGATVGINDRTIVDTGTCNTCHGRLELHGGARLDTGMCVLCHNPGSADANSGNTLDFRVMIHKLHAGEELPSVVAGGDYTIYGFNDTPHDYSDVVFPRNIRSCTVCHDPADAATPEAVNITANPSIEACGACHDDVDFAAGIAGGHEGGAVTDNSECTTCHAADRVAGDILEDHAISTIVAGERFQFNLLSVTQTAPGQTPQVVLSVTDPTNSNAPYNILTAPEFTGASMTARFGWDTGDYSNWPGGLITGNTPAMPRNVNVLTTAVNNGDGTFTVNAPTAVPAAGVGGSGVVTLEGRARVNSENIPITAAVRYFAITDAQPVPRRQVVDTAKCQVCHGERDRLAFHGGGRTDNVELCVVCHNANVTDISRRPVDPMTTIDGRVEQSAHFKYMIHSIHGAAQRDLDKPYVVYGFGSTAHDFSDVRYPRPASDCAACHVDDSIELPLPTGVFATTVSTGADRYDPVDDLNITAAAAACGSCHNDDLAEAHMLQNGALFDQTQGTIDSSTVETCAVCHGPGSLADVEVMHAD
jgi:OmcA/MtrC family decaheme c-type cytochrome